MSTSFLPIMHESGWTHMERERVARLSLCYSCSAVLQISGCFTGRHGREVLQTIHGRLREIWRMMRRLCAVAQWWKWLTWSEFWMLRAAVGCSLGLLGFFGTLFLFCLLNTNPLAANVLAEALIKPTLVYKDRKGSAALFKPMPWVTIYKENTHENKRNVGKYTQTHTFSTKGINCWYSASVFSSSIMKGR